MSLMRIALLALTLLTLTGCAKEIHEAATPVRAPMAVAVR